MALNLKICTWNVCLGAKFKKHHIISLLEEHSIDILCIQEAEIKYDDDTSLLDIQGYSVEIEKGIQNEKRRTMLYVKNSVKYVRQIQTEKSGAHIMLLKIECDNKSVCLASIYRTYKLTGHISHLQAFQEQLDILQVFMDANQGENFIIMGDMNLDERRRSDRSYNLHQLYQLWDEFERERNLTQMVNFSTWTRLHAGNLRQSIIDHVYVDNQTLVEYVEEVSVTIGDHVPVLVSLKCKTKTEKRTVYIRNWKDYTKENLEQELAKEDWNIRADSSEDFSNIFENKLLGVLEHIIPYEYKINRGGWYPDPEKLLRLKKKRKNLFLNAKRRGDGGRLQRCKALDKKINAMQRRGRWNGIRKKILEGGQQGLWKGLRLAQSKPVEPIPKEIKSGTERYVTPSHQAQAFANYFKAKVEKVVEENQINHQVNNGTRIVDCDNHNFFTLDLVRKIIMDLKYKPCFGSDRIPLKVLKDGIDFLAQPILQLMNLIYEQNEVPKQWKVSRIIPLHKKGPRTNIANYRPISNLCSTSKIFEKAILSRIMEIEKENNVDLTGARQHGYKKKKSTVTAALHLQAQIAKACDKKKYVAVASLDLSSAFDVINVDLLLVRLSIMGLPEDLILLLNSWLKNRSAFVEVDGECSEHFEVPNGSVQGSSLGPVLFNLFVAPNTEPEAAYADDGYYIAVHEEKTQALKDLEEKLIRAEQWLSGSGLKVNASKTELVIFHKHDSARGSIFLNQIRIE
jgi:endonuclease/exonuclease/phosphatase family metal-dependent hydrolase